MRSGDVNGEDRRVENERFRRVGDFDRQGINAACCIAERRTRSDGHFASGGVDSKSVAHIARHDRIRDRTTSILEGWGQLFHQRTGWRKLQNTDRGIVQHGSFDNICDVDGVCAATHIDAVPDLDCETLGGTRFIIERGPCFDQPCGGINTEQISARAERIDQCGARVGIGRCDGAYGRPSRSILSHRENRSCWQHRCYGTVGEVNRDRGIARSGR